MKKGRFRTIDEIKDANRARGHFFFSHSTMRFFDSRVEAGLYGGRYFITSEQFHASDGTSAPRKYTIRCVKDDGSIERVGDFEKTTDLEEARRTARELASKLT